MNSKNLGIPQKGLYITVLLGIFLSAFYLGGALAFQASDGKYVLGGTTYDGTQYDFAIARVLP